MKSRYLEPEKNILDILLKLFSEQFPSEILYTIWDVIIYEDACCRDNNSINYIFASIMALLLDRLSSKLMFIFSQKEFMIAIKLEGIIFIFNYIIACLISNMDLFMINLKETQIKMRAMFTSE